eukprot:8048550-Pyramimonas_sp.AAC.1
MEAGIVDWAKEVDEFIYEPATSFAAQGNLPPWAREGLSRAKKELKFIALQFRKAGKRRAAPPWPLPLGVCWALSHPCRGTSKI